MKRTSAPRALLLAAAIGVASQCQGAQPGQTNTAASSNPASDLFGNPVIAKGKGFEIKRNEFDDEVIRAKSQVAARGQPLTPEQSALLERQILDQLIQVQLLSAKATDADKATGKAAAEKKFAEAKAKLGSDEALTRQLKVMGATEADVLNKWGEALTAEAVLKRELKVEITDADAKKYYDENPSRFEQPEMVRASHILLSTRDPKTGTELSEVQKAEKKKEMEGLLKRARAGEDFAKLAQEYSEDPGSKDKGGEYKFPRGQMVPEFEAAAFALKTNEVSDIVTTQFGYHIIKLSEKIPAHKIEFAKACSDIKDGLSQQAMQKQFPTYMANLKKEAGVEVLDEKLKPLEAAESSSGLPPGHPPVQPTSKAK